MHLLVKFRKWCWKDLERDKEAGKSDKEVKLRIKRNKGKDILSDCLPEQGAKVMRRNNRRFWIQPLTTVSRIPVSLVKLSCLTRSIREEEPVKENIKTDSAAHMLVKIQQRRQETLRKPNSISSQVLLLQDAFYWSKPSSLSSRCFLWEQASKPTQGQQVQPIQHAAMPFSISRGSETQSERQKRTSSPKLPRTPWQRKSLRLRRQVNTFLWLSIQNEFLT